MTPEYIAGFLDADGSVFINSAGKCKVEFSNTNLPQLEAIHKKLGCGHIYCYDRPRYGKEYRLCVERHKDVAMILSKLAPHLVRKRVQAYTVLAAAMLPRATRLAMKPDVAEMNRRRTPVEALAPMKVYR